MIENIKYRKISHKILYLEADEEVIVRRYNETRRAHPLLKEGKSILESIKLEKARLQEIKNLATDIIDTSSFSLKDLREKITATLRSSELNLKANFIITITSFGFKHGIPIDAHLIFDVRFIPNPFYDPELRPLSGESERVKTFVLSKKETQEFLEYLKKFIDFVIPLYQEEGRTNLNIAIGCTGGRHRAVVIVDEISNYLSQKYIVNTFHRDIDKA
ncbi:MAG: RNase adapter RapZ, partial [Dictyoglomus sp.]